MSKTLPWRTLATPLTPSDFRAPSIALPCGSRIPDFKVTVTRALMTRAPAAVAQPIQYGRIGVAATGRPGLMHRLLRLFEQPAVAIEAGAFANEAHGRPERRRRRRHHRDAMAVFERLGDTERAQSAAGDQNALRPVGVLDRAVAERDDVGLAL